LKDFEQIDQLPKHLKNLCERLYESKIIYDELVQNNALIHKSCSSEYNKRQYERKKRKFDEMNNDEEYQNGKIDDNNVEAERKGQNYGG